jgi:hypothetical protein
LIFYTTNDVLGKKSRHWLKTLEVRPCYRQELEGYSRLAEVLSSLVAGTTVAIKQLVEASSQAQLLMTISGQLLFSSFDSQ